MQGDLVFPTAKREVTAHEILRQCATAEDSIDMSLHVAGINRKSLAFHLELTEAQLSRKLRNDPNDPQHFAFRDALRTMELTRNIIPARFLCLKMNHDAEPLKSWERVQLEQKDREIEELKKKLGYFEELIAKVRL